jgi:AcrR family transcriptional regulator
MDPDSKRARIMSAGERLFSEKGYTATSMAEIAEAAEVSVGSVYRLFPDKPSLLASLHAAMEDKFILAMERGWNEACAYPDRFEPMVAAILAQADKVKAIMPLYTLTRDMVGASDFVPGARMIATIDRLYRAGVAAKALRAFSDGVQAPIAHGIVEGALRAWMQNPTTRRRRSIVAETAKILQRAFVAAG